MVVTLDGVAAVPKTEHQEQADMLAQVRAPTTYKDKVQLREKMALFALIKYCG